MHEIIWNGECTEEKKKGFQFTFGKGLLIYVGVWLVAIAVICIKLWGVLGEYQNHYDAAAKRANPDILMPDIVEMYLPQQIVETAGTDWCKGISEYESQDVIEAVLTSAVEGKQLKYRRSDAFTDRRPVYDILADGKPVGLVTLKQEQASDQYGFHLCTLEKAQVLVEQPELSSVQITVSSGDQVSVNGKELPEDFETDRIGLDSLMAKEAVEYTGISHEKSVYVIDGFISQPQVAIVHDGVYQTLSQIEDGQYEAVCFAEQSFVDEIRDSVLAVGEAYVKNMNRMASFWSVAQYFEHGSNAYQMLQSAQSGLAWAGRPEDLQIEDAQITDVVQYGEDAFTVRTCYKTHRLYREVEYEEEQSLEWLYVNKNGSWMVRDFALAK